MCQLSRSIFRRAITGNLEGNGKWWQGKRMVRKKDLVSSLEFEKAPLMYCLWDVDNDCNWCCLCRRYFIVVVNSTAGTGLPLLLSSADTGENSTAGTGAPHLQLPLLRVVRYFYRWYRKVCYYLPSTDFTEERTHVPVVWDSTRHCWLLALWDPCRPITCHHGIPTGLFHVTVGSTWMDCMLSRDL